MSDYFAKGTEKSRILGNLLDREVESLEDRGCPKIQDLSDAEIWICSNTHSNTRPRFTLQSVKQNCLVTG